MGWATAVRDSKDSCCDRSQCRYLKRKIHGHYQKSIITWCTHARLGRACVCMYVTMRLQEGPRQPPISGKRISKQNRAERRWEPDKTSRECRSAIENKEDGGASLSTFMRLFESHLHLHLHLPAQLVLSRTFPSHPLNWGHVPWRSRDLALHR